MWLIEFNRDALAWTVNDSMNWSFIEGQFDYFKAKLEHFGYLYMNDIYECLGVKWNPNEVNFCFRDFDDLEFSVGSAGDLTYLIKIKCPRLEAL